MGLEFLFNRYSSLCKYKLFESHYSLIIILLFSFEPITSEFDPQFELLRRQINEVKEINVDYENPVDVAPIKLAQNILDAILTAGMISK